MWYNRMGEIPCGYAMYHPIFADCKRNRGSIEGTINENQQRRKIRF